MAHRTSPTNIGLYLLSTVAARDFGWLGTVDAVERLEATTATMSGLERFRGHYYNWYDTKDGRPLDPKYVSSVDSGNLAGHLIALGHACREMIIGPLLAPAALAGIGDAALLVRESARAVTGDQRARSITRQRLHEALDAVAAAVSASPHSPGQWADRLAELEASARVVTGLARTLAQEDGARAQPDVVVWAEALQAGVESHARDLDTMMPWARLLAGDAVSHLTPSAIEPLVAPLPALADMPDRCEAAVRELTVLLRARREAEGAPGPGRIEALIDELERSAAAANALIRRLTILARNAETMVTDMDFGFLFDPMRQLFALGYRVTDGNLDSGRYDLLASEARLTSFVAIAKGDVPVSTWFRLGRALTPVEQDSILVSWSGSMFEYLMPALVMRAPAGSLLDQTCRLVVRRQIAYGAERGVPWGVSESGYNARDLEMTYQYSNFGVPGLGLRRGLSEDVVIAPYATGLAAMIDPAAALKNFRRLAAAGASGGYGFYEALDYTAPRLPEDAQVAVVRTYMAHHQGMMLVAIANALHDGVMRARFHAEPIVQATELLLQERTPRDVAVARPRAEEVAAVGDVREFIPAVVRRFTSPHGSTPRTHLLSNGRYAVMVTAAGSGYSRWRDLAVTRWREDATRDAGGTYIFLRDPGSGESWSAGYQPRGGAPDSYEVTFSEDRAEIVRRDGAISARTEVIVSSEDDAEVRRVSLTNLGARTREIELTSYAEIVLAPPPTDAAHPAFSNLFVQTEAAPELDTLLATRRPRSRDQQPIWLAHVVVVDGETVGELEWETDRARFLGRGRGIRTPRSVIDGGTLSNTVGPVLDPIVSLRRRVRLRPGATARVTFSTLVAPTREEALALADKYHDVTTFERAATLAWTQAQVQLHHLGVGPDEAHLFQTLAGAILYSDRTLRSPSDVLARHAGGPAVLWAHGISGDIPIVLVQIDEPEDVGIVRQLLRAHEYWGLKRLAVDLVILNERAPSYLQELQALLETLVRASHSPSPNGGHDAARARLHPPGGPRDGAATRCAARGGARGAVEPTRDSGRTDCPPAAIRERQGVLAKTAGGAEVPAGHPAPAAGSRAVQRHRRLCREWTGVRDGPGRGGVDSGPVDQRHRESGLRLPGLRVGLGVHVVDQQSGEPAHRVVKRSGERSIGRDDLRQGRREWRAVGPDGAPDPGGRRALHGPARSGLHSVRARRPRHLPRAPAVRAARGPDQGVPSHGEERVRTIPPAVCHRVRRVGPRRVAVRLRAVHRHRDRPDDGGDARPQHLEP